MILDHVDTDLLEDLIEDLPRAPHRGLRKLEAEVAIRLTYLRTQHTPEEKSWYRVEVWRVEHTHGARWVRAPRSSHVHRRMITRVKTMLRAEKLLRLAVENP